MKFDTSFLDRRRRIWLGFALTVIGAHVGLGLWLAHTRATAPILPCRRR